MAPRPKKVASSAPAKVASSSTTKPKKVKSSTSKTKKKSAATAASASATTTTAKTEKRLKRYRSSCPAKLEDRLLRANTQRLYLIQQKQHNDDTERYPYCDFSVLGSTGNVYTVQLQHVPCCDCPDFCRQQDLCKHILFVLLKVIGLSCQDPLAFQKAYVTSELHELMEKLNARRVGGGGRRNKAFMANEHVQANFAALQGQGAANEEAKDKETGVPRRSLEDEDDLDCPICFDAMHPETDKLTYCRTACGANFHADCIRRWLRNCNGPDPTCPNCRQPWWEEETTNKKKKIKGDEGYVNLGRLQGQSPTRDTSTYYQSPRRRGARY